MISLLWIGFVLQYTDPMRKILLIMAVSAAALLAQAPPNFKNLQVLKPTDIRSGMGAAVQGLGVQCSECHVQGDNSLDDKPAKVIARKMFAMTAEINSKFPDGKAHVSCYTCHRGEKSPAMAPPAK
jgi:Photosynthetic reaction centre cytochrome C subunit